jgi:hypothetical protein
VPRVDHLNSVTEPGPVAVPEEILDAPGSKTLVDPRRRDTCGIAMASLQHPLWRYHEATKHSPAGVRSSPHFLDWSNKPLPFKVYPSLEGIPPPDDIGRLCLYSNGVLRWRQYSDGEVYGFRAAPSTGALYHVEMYLATAERSDLSGGLYHYSAHDHALRLLRAGDFRGTLLQATGGFQPLASAPLVFVLTSTFWRNAWKYRARSLILGWSRSSRSCPSDRPAVRVANSRAMSYRRTASVSAAAAAPGWSCSLPLRIGTLVVPAEEAEPRDRPVRVAEHPKQELGLAKTKLE